jgi:hypothetical protein
MSTIDLCTFRDANLRHSAPRTMFQYLESDTGNYWTIWASAGYAYMYRTGEEIGTRSIGERKKDAEYMIRRLQSSLLIANKGLFKYGFESMWTLDKIGFVPKSSTVNCVLPATDSEQYDKEVPDWFGAFSKHTLLRRAAEDSHKAAVIEEESIFFLYRGFEWLKEAVGNPSWKQLGKHIDVPQENIENIKKIANNPKEAGRHAVESGLKSYFDVEVCSSWVCGLLHAIAHVRGILEPDFEAKLKKDGNPWPI